MEILDAVNKVRKQIGSLIYVVSPEERAVAESLYANNQIDDLFVIIDSNAGDYCDMLESAARFLEKHYKSLVDKENNIVLRVVGYTVMYRCNWDNVAWYLLSEKTRFALSLWKLEHRIERESTAAY